MKKIIATVLAMVMALALCSTAFAATTYDNGYKWNGTGWEKYDLSGVTVSYTNPTETKKNGEFQKATIGFFTIDGVDFVEVPQNDATYRINADGVTKYLAKAGANYKTAYTMKGESVDAASTVNPKCTDVQFLGATTELYKNTDGVYYVAGGSDYMLVDGQVIAVTKAVEGTNYKLVGHAWKVTSSTKAADGTVTGTAKCDRCGLEGTLTSKKGTIPSNASSELYAKSIVDFGKDVWVYWTEKGASAGSTTGSKPSPKTFDAGIALYAAMALTSVAGSAVVIGKKKEF